MRSYQYALSGAFLIACIVIAACSQQAPAPTAVPAPSAPAATNAPAPTDLPAATKAPEPTAAPVGAQTNRSEQRLIYFFGMITAKDEISLEPWETFSDTTAVADTKGPFMVQALDASGAVVASQAFDVQFNLPDNPPLPEAPFDGVMRFPNETVKFQVLKDTTILKELAVSKNPPVISDVSAIKADGTSTFTWKASDADNDKLSYSLEFTADASADDPIWEVLATNLSKPEFAIDFSELSGGTNASLRIGATDGVLTTYADTEPFEVAAKPPEVTIPLPLDGLNYPEQDHEITLYADVFDLQDENLADDQIEWSSDIGGKLGTGAEIYVTGLAKGTHTITVKATNSAGLSSTATTQIIVGNVAEQYIPFPAEEQEITVEQIYEVFSSSVTIPSTALVTETYIMLATSPLLPHATPPEGFKFANQNVSLKADVVDGEDWIAVDFTPSTPVILTLKYIDSLSDDMKLDSLRLYRWVEKVGDNGEVASEWVDAASECSPASSYDYSVAGQVSLPICQFGEFALVGIP